MFIIIDKTTNKIKQTIDINYGLKINTNELLQEVTDNALINKIRSAYEYDLIFDGNGNVTDVNITKTLEQYKQEQSQLPQPPTNEERLASLELAMLDILAI